MSTSTHPCARSPRPRGALRLGASLVCAAGTWVAAATGCGGEQEVLAVEPAAGIARLVATQTIVPGPVAVRLTERVAVLEPAEIRRLAFEVSGRLETVLPEGATVRADTPVARLADALERARVKRAEATLRSAESERRRLEGLSRRNAASEKALEAAQVQAEISQAEMTMAQEELSRRTLLAGIDGVLADMSAEPSELVVPQREIATVIDTTELRWVVGIPSYQIGRVRVGVPVELRVPALGDARFEAHVTWVAPAALLGEHLFEVEARVANPDGRIRAGMAAWGAIVTDRLDSAIAAPIDAVVERDGRRVVFFVAGGHAQAVEIAGAVETGRQLLLPGTIPHRELVVRGQHNLGDGDAVRVNNAVLEAEQLLP